VITIDVLGIPAPKGSSRAISIGGHARLIASSSDTNARKQRAWVKAIQTAARCEVVSGPVWVQITFRLPRPAGHYGKRGLRASAPLHPLVHPDIDKLARTTLDALTGLAFEDDSRIVSLHVQKLYATPGREGACIAVGRWDELEVAA
jgi:Holliday junction resolvase RusA-like endonuclease